MKTSIRVCLISLLLFTDGAEAAEPSSADVISTPGPAVFRSVSANRDSVAPFVTVDGRRIFFLSTASDLVPQDTNGAVLDLFVSDRTNATISLVSSSLSGGAGGNGDTTDFACTADGRIVAFTSAAGDLVLGDTNDANDVFVRDLESGGVTLISVSASGSATGQGASSDPAITPDGRYVAFSSTADDLVDDDGNGLADVFVRDLAIGSTRLVSVGAQGIPFGWGGSRWPAISDDGRFVAFVSSATNLVPGIVNFSGEVYVRDLSLNVTMWGGEGVASYLQESFGIDMRGYMRGYRTSWQPVLSRDGRYLAYRMTFVTGGSADPMAVILHRGLDDGTLALVTPQASDLSMYCPDSNGPEMTPDGRFIAYVTGQGTVHTNSVCIWDATLGQSESVSVGNDGLTPGNGFSLAPRVSSDGRFVAFLSKASNLVTEPVAEGFQVYLRDRQAGTTRLISARLTDLGDGRSPGSADAAHPSLSDDGRLVAWDSSVDLAVAGDLNRAYDVFARDPGSTQLEVISAAWNAGAPASAFGVSWLRSRSYSADGRRLVFTSQADNLVPNDRNHCTDVFVRELVAGTNALVSVEAAGVGSGDASSAAPILSGNGRYVAFVSFSTNLTHLQDTNRVEDVFVRDLESGATQLASVSIDGTTAGDGASLSPTISADGRWLAFHSKARGLAPGDDDSYEDDVFLRDLQTGVTRWVSSDPGLFPPMTPCRNAVLSPDGRFLSYTASPLGADHLVLVDLQHDGPHEILATQFPVSMDSFGVVISGDSRVLVSITDPSDGGPAIRWLWRNLMTGVSRTVALAAADTSDSIPDHFDISNDGRWVSFSTRRQSGSSSVDPFANIFLWDTATDNFRLVSTAADGLSAGNGASDGPTISADGRFVAYHTYAGDIVADDADELGDVIVYDRLTGRNQLASDPVAVAALAEGPLFVPTIDPAGTFVVFGSGTVDRRQIPDAGFPFLVQKPFSRWTAIDSDDDRLEDSWEQTCFDNLTQSDNDDPDLDTILNYAEYVAGTDPTDPASQFRVQIDDAMDLTITLSWPAIAGRGYLIEYRDDLPGAAWQTAPALISIHAAQARASGLPAPAGMRRFYRVLIGVD